MATGSNSKKQKNSPPSDRNDINIFTLNGYTEVFGTDENNSKICDRFYNYKICQVEVDPWRTYLIDMKKYDEVKQLFSYWDDYCDSNKLIKKDDLKKFIELFSLAENVLRNTLLRPYIPAYRTINMNCGRYITSRSTYGDELFKKLEFRDNSKNLLTYQGENQQLTILYALTCFVFWTELSTRSEDKRGILV